MAEGNTLGPRQAYTYTDDGDRPYYFYTDESLGAATDQDIADFSADPPPQDLPRAFTPRCVFAVAKDNPSLRKTLIIGSRASALYAANRSQDVTIDGVEFRTTGRRGESKTFRGGSTEGGGGDPPAEP